jgi:RNA polymerase sigma factor (sigma-70 family)
MFLARQRRKRTLSLNQPSDHEAGQATPDWERGRISVENESQSLEFARLQEILLAYFRNKTRNEEDAQDLVQNVLLATHEALQKEGFSLEKPLEHYVFGIALNHCKEYYRRLSQQPATTSLTSELEERGVQRTTGFVQHTSSMATVDNEQYIKQLLNIIQQRLSGDEQHVVALMYQGEKQESIAQLLEMPATTVRSHVLRGRARLLAYLVEHEPEMLGGAAIIRSAWEAVLQEVPPPSVEEIAAWEAYKPAGKFRDACLKMARYLPSPLTQ